VILRGFNSKNLITRGFGLSIVIEIITRVVKTFIKKITKRQVTAAERILTFYESKPAGE